MPVTTSVPRVGGPSPWGTIQEIDYIAEKLIMVSTAGHGGIFVPDDLLDAVSAEGRAYARAWSRDEHWFEEDCAVAYVILAFPLAFSEEARAGAERMMEFIKAHPD